MGTVLEYATPQQSAGKRIRLLVFIFLVAQIIGVAAGWITATSLTTKPAYSTSGLLAFNRSGAASVSAMIAQQQACVATMTSPSFLAAVSVATGVPASNIAASQKILPIRGSQLVQVWYTSTNPTEASTVAKTLMATYVALPSSSGTYVIANPRAPVRLRNSFGVMGAVGGWLIGICLCIGYAIFSRRVRVRALRAADRA